MAEILVGQRFSELPAAGALSGSELVAVTQGGQSVQTTAQDIADKAAPMTGAAIKAAYEGQADTNAFDDVAKAKLAGIESGATADQTAAEIEAAYSGQVAQISAAEITAGTEAAVRRMSPADMKALVEAHGLTSQAYDLGFDFPGNPGADEVVGRWYVLRSVTLAADFAGSGGAIDTARYRSAYVPKGFTCSGGWSIANTIDVDHPAVVGSVTWIHANLYLSTSPGGSNVTGRYWFDCYDAASNLLFEFKNSGAAGLHELRVFGDTTVAQTYATPHTGGALKAVDVKVDLSGGNIHVQVYDAGGTTPIYDVTAANKFRSTQRRQARST